MTHKTFTIKSISSLIQHIEKHGVSFSYRGQAQDWPLLPSIARVHKGGFDVLSDFEYQILSEFRRLASPYFERPPTDFSEWILHAQHHGLPTRLLDWTTNPLKALYFAVEDTRNNNDAVVWSSDANSVEWNEELPNLKCSKPYFHRPTHINKRIISQESVFLVFPLKNSQETIEPPKLDDSEQEIFGRVEKFIIPSSSKDAIKRRLDDLGINSLTIYPSIESAANTIRQSFYMDI